MKLLNEEDRSAPDEGQLIADKTVRPKVVYDSPDESHQQEKVMEDSSVVSAYQDRGGGSKEEIERKLLSKRQGKKSNEESVDCLIEGVKECHINKEEKTSGKEEEEDQLSEKLTQLSLKNVRQEPREDDERGSCAHSEEDVKNKKMGHDQRWVTLEEPSPHQELAVEETDGKNKVLQRSPAGGVAVYPNRVINNNNNTNGGNMYTNQQMVPSSDSLAWQQHYLQQQAMPMPTNFPNHQQYHQHNANTTATGPGLVRNKRSFDVQDTYSDAPKYVRPEQMPQNNLDAPGLPLSPTSFKPVSTVCTKQMSGATVLQQETPSVPPIPNHQQPQQHEWNMDYPQSYQQHHQPLLLDDYANNLDAEMLKDLLEDHKSVDRGQATSEEFEYVDRLVADSIAVHRRLDKTIIEKDLEPILTNNSVMPGISVYNEMDMKGLPTTTTTVSNHYQYQQQQQQQQMYYLPTSSSSINYNNNNSSGTPSMLHQPHPHRNSLEDNGYNTDQSPSHESSQFSPGPTSVIMGSPASSGVGNSPPHHWSPPPSNVSDMSQDSGVCSPLSEDGRAAIYGQMGTEGNMLENASPPQYASVLNGQMGHTRQQPCDGALSQNPPLEVDLGYIVPPLDDPLSQLAGDDGSLYKDKFVDDNLEYLNDVVSVLAEDVKSTLQKKTQPQPPPAPHHHHPHNDQQQQQHYSQQQQLWQQQQLLRQQQTAAGQATTTSAPAVVSTSALTQGNINNIKGNPQPPTLMSNGCQNQITTNINAPIVTTIATATTISSSSSKKMTGTVANQAPVPPANLTYYSPTGTLQVNNKNKGKVPIPRIQQQNQGATPQRQRMTPIFVLTQKPRFANIAPKEPNRPNGDSNGANNNNNNSSSNNNNVTRVNGACPINDQPPTMHQSTSASLNSNANSPPHPNNLVVNKATKKLNCARRSVARLERKDLEFTDREGDTNLHVAVCRTEKTDPYLIQALLERLLRENLTSMINAQNITGQTPLYLAVSINDPKKVTVLVEKGAEVNLYADCLDYDGAREKIAAIHCASSKGEDYLATLKALLAAPGIQVDLVDSQGRTALQRAILCHGDMVGDNQQINSIPIMETLVKAGADPNRKVQNGRTALMFALETRHVDLFEKLFSLVSPENREACLKTQDNKGNTILKIAERLKATLSINDQQRLHSCLRRSSYQRTSAGSNGATE